MLRYSVFCLVLVCALARNHHKWNRVEPFLKSVTDEARQEFNVIMRNNSLSRKEMKMKIDDWAQKQGKDVATQVSSFQSDRDKWFEDARTNRSRILEGLPDALKKWEDIRADDDLNRMERRKKTVELLKSLDADTVSILRFIMKTVPRYKKKSDGSEKRRRVLKKSHRKNKNLVSVDMKDQNETISAEKIVDNE